YEFTVQPPREGAEPEVTEGSELDRLPPADLVCELARRKGRDVADQLASGPSQSQDWVVLAADTVADCQGRVLGKPCDVEHAREILSQLSGCEHRVYTGVGIVTAKESSPYTEAISTILQMAPLEPSWLEPYLASGRWEGKAGAFGYQDGLSFVRIVAGSESNVVGLPMERVAELLAQRGCFPGHGG
ncbi:MAG: Maf family protein, partial [Planctomycetota bacterium]